MKHLYPNILIIASGDDKPDIGSSHQLARVLSEQGWVYFAEQNREEVEDSDEGIRFLHWQDTLVDHFGSLDAVVVIDNRELAVQLSQRLSEVSVILLDRTGTTITENSLKEPGVALLECYNRASPLMAVVERFAFSSASALAAC